MTKKVKNMTVVLATGWDENNNCPWELKGSVFKANIIRKRIKHYRAIYKTSTVKSKANNTGDWYWFNAFDFYTNWINETFSKEYENDSFWRLMDENTWKELKKYSHNVFLKEKESGVFYFPSSVAYGYRGDKDKISFNQPIIAKIEVFKIEKNQEDVKPRPE